MSQSLCISPSDQQLLLVAARKAIASRWQGQSIAKLTLPLSLKDQALGNFVSLHKQGGLRGCIGVIETKQPLSTTLARNALSCAFKDPRFPPLTQDELAQCQIEVSILSPTQPLSFSSKKELLGKLDHQHGLILEDGHRRAVFLPQVWQQLPQAEQFVNALLRKGGWPNATWPTGIKAHSFSCIVMAEQ